MKELNEARESFLFHCQYEKNLTEKTLKAYQIDLKQFFQFLATEKAVMGPEEVDKQSIRGFLKQITETAKPKTIKRKMATLKAFFNFLEFEDLITVSPFRKMRIKITQDAHLPEVATLAEIKQLITHLYRQKQNVAGRTPLGQKTLIRDIAIIELLFGTGIRVSELCNLTQNALNLELGVVNIWGKGRRERQVPLCDGKLIEAMRAYETAFEKDLQETPHYFVNRFGKKVSEQSVRILLEKHTKAAGLTKRITPHTLRHTIATLLLENGVDIRNIQYLLGHSTILTTQLYTKVNGEAQRKIIGQHHPRSVI